MKYTLTDILLLRRLRGKAASSSSDSQGGGSASTANIMVIHPANVDREPVDTTSDPETGDISFDFHMQVTYDKTWQEVHDALEADIPVYLDGTDLTLFKMEEEYFNYLSTGVPPTVANFEKAKASTIVRMAVSAANRYPNDPTTFYIQASTQLVGDVSPHAASANAALTEEYSSHFIKPTDWPQDEPGQE